MSDKTQRFLPSLWTDNPFTDLRKEVDQALQSFFGNRPGAAEGGLGVLPFRAPSIDVVENESSIVLTAELPGLDEKDVELSVSNGLLTVKGEKKLEKKDEKDNYHVIERRYGAFQRSVRLPDTVDEAAISAKYDKGVLTVTLPKKPEAATPERKIEIGK